VPALTLTVALAWLAWLLTLPPRPSTWVIVGSGLPLLTLASWLQHLSSGQQWRTFVRNTADWHALGVVLLIALGVQFEDAHGVTTDGVIYFSQLRSVLFDRDLDVAAEFVFLGQPARPYHVVPIGPTVVWLPLYGAVALVDALGRSVGWWSAPAEPVGIGLTLPYVRAALVSSFALGASGLLLVHRYLRSEFGRGIALTTSLLVFGATPLVWYMVYEPSMTHAASFGFVAIFVAMAMRWTTPAITARQSIMLGALLGLAFIARPQEAVFALFPAVLLVTSGGTGRARVAATAKLAAWALVGAAPFLAAQAFHSSILFAREQLALVGNNGYLDFWHSRWADTLWSSWHGFLSWTPVAYIALLGTVALIRRQWRWAAATLLIVFVMAWVNGSTSDWAAGWSFGGRRFTSCLVLLAPGLAVVVAFLVRRPMFPIALVAALAVVWNLLITRQYADGTLRVEQTTGFGTMVRQQAALVTRAPFVYPFAFPANAWFAWRTGLPIDSYDVLSPETPRAGIELPFDANVGKFLIDGWGARAADQWGELRWIDRARAELVLPLAASDVARTLEITARTRLVAPPVSTKLTIAIDGQSLGTLVPNADHPSSGTFVIAPSSLPNGFHRVVITKDGDVAVAIYSLAVR